MCGIITYKTSQYKNKSLTCKVMNFMQWHLLRWSLMWLWSLSWMFQRLPLSPTSADNVMSEAAVHSINTEGMFSELSVLFPEWTTWGNSEESPALTHHVHHRWLRQIISACNGHELCIHRLSYQEDANAHSFSDSLSILRITGVT